MAATMYVAALALFAISMVDNVHGAHFTYTPSDKAYPCIMMDAKFTIRINAIRYMRTIATDVIKSEDEIIDITGSCGASTAILNLAFGGGRITWSFIFRINGDTVTLDRLIQFVPNNIFASYVTNISKPLTFDDPNTIDLSFKNESYTCNTVKENKYFPIKPTQDATTFQIQVTLNKMKAQAFGVKWGRYSSHALCHDDLANATTTTSTTSTTTMMTTEQSPRNAPDNIYAVTNRDNTTLCLELASRIDIDIRYKYNTTDGWAASRVVSFPIPSNATWYGDCSLEGGRQNLVIEFFKPTWRLEFIFKELHSANTSKFNEYLVEKSQSALDYTIENINLVYVIDQERFPGTNVRNGTEVRESSTDEESRYPHKSTGHDYFVCASDVKLKINKNAGITTEELKFKAFNSDNNYKFEGSSSKCSADNNDHALHFAIIVSCVMGGIILIIIVIVIIMVFGRKRKRRHYRPIKSEYDFVYH